MKEASTEEKRYYLEDFSNAKTKECQSWFDEEVYELVDLRKTACKNFVTGRWVLTIKRKKDGSFDICKARWVLRGFQDKQAQFLQTDAPTSTRPGFRLACQVAANNKWSMVTLI